MTPEERGKLFAQHMYDELEKISSAGVGAFFRNLFGGKKDFIKHNIRSLDDFIKAEDDMLEAYRLARKTGKSEHFGIAHKHRRSMEHAQKAVLKDLDKHISTYTKKPSSYANIPDAPDIKKVEKFRDYVKKQSGLANVPFGGQPTKMPSWTPKPKEPSRVLKGADDLARKLGYGVLIGGGAYGGYKLYKRNQRRKYYSNPYSSVYYGR